MTPVLARKILMSARTAIGWGSLLAPSMVLRLFGVRGPLRGELKYAMRLFGVRDVIMAYQLYQAQRIDAPEGELEESLRQGMMVDGFDTVSALAGGLSGQMRAKTAFLGAAGAAGAFALGYLGRESGPPRATVVPEHGGGETP